MFPRLQSLDIHELEHLVVLVVVVVEPNNGIIPGVVVDVRRGVILLLLLLLPLPSCSCCCSCCALITISSFSFRALALSSFSLCSLCCLIDTNPLPASQKLPLRVCDISFSLDISRDFNSANPALNLDVVVFEPPLPAFGTNENNSKFVPPGGVASTSFSSLFFFFFVVAPKAASSF